VEIQFEDGGLECDWNDFRKLVRKFNVQRAKLIRRRLDELRAAPNLIAMRSLPGRCHELTSDRAFQLSVDLDGPNRLIFTPAHDPIPTKPDGGLDWAKVTAVTVIEMVDTHE
jgi:plasmid maintenance system killer protein